MWGIVYLSRLARFWLVSARFYVLPVFCGSWFFVLWYFVLPYLFWAFGFGDAGAFWSYYLPQ
jgi:hypothetical protein